jgi:hypothetical protein
MKKAYQGARAMAALAWLLGSGWTAHAAITQNDAADGSGDMANISYGAANDGSVVHLYAQLYPGFGIQTKQVQQSVTNFTDLKFDFSMTGDGQGLLELDYKLTNTGIVSRTDMRFMSILFADGNPNTFQESVVEKWGAAAAGDATRRQTVAYDGVVDNALNNVWLLNNGAAGPDGSGVPATCASSTGCDSFVGLQWDLAELKPGETWTIRVGLSDDAQALSSRFFTLTADPTGGFSNSMTFSGEATVTAVPEPASALLLLAGLGAVGLLARRRVTTRSA